MSRIRAVFFGTPDIARFCLEAMIKDPHYEVVGVITQPDRPAGRNMKLQPSPVKQLVQPLGIPVFTPDSVNESEMLRALESLRAEVAVVVAYGQILKQPLLDLYPQKVINLHASLLPRWRGAAPIQRALMEGDLETGVCLQVMVKKLDAGAVLASRKIAINAEMNAIELYSLCQEHGAKLIEVEMMDYLRGNLTPIPQDDSQVTYAKKIEKHEAQIDWSWPAERIHNLVRGLALGPVAQTLRDGKILKIHRTRVQDRPSAARPGEITTVTEKMLIVQCGQGSLEILEIQPESRSKMSVDVFLRGYQVRPGERLGSTIESSVSSRT